MSRDLTTAFKTAITGEVVTPVVLTEAFFDSGTIRFWNGLGDFVYDGDTYTGSGNLLEVSQITETSNLEARGASFTLSGLPSSLIAIALAEDWQGRTITQRFAPLDANGDAIADPFLFFSGECDAMDIEEAGSGANIKIAAENDILTLKRKSERRRTPEDQKIDYPTDSFFDQVAALQSLDIVWGRG